MKERLVKVTLDRDPCVPAVGFLELAGPQGRRRGLRRLLSSLLLTAGTAVGSEQVPRAWKPPGLETFSLLGHLGCPRGGKDFLYIQSSPVLTYAHCLLSFYHMESLDPSSQSPPCRHVTIVSALEPSLPPTASFPNADAPALTALEAFLQLFHSFLDLSWYLNKTKSVLESIPSSFCFL